MGGKMEACAECSRSCLSLHRNKCDPYPIVSSFFKVMFGKQFSEELIVPPRFARTIASLKGKNTYLEDSTGQIWNVHLSSVNGSLVFRKGWLDFALDHGIELGDFVVFHYIIGSHFDVEIFTRSGCERPALFGVKNYQNKRRKLARDSIDRNVLSDQSNKESAPPKESLDSCVVDIQRPESVRKSLIVADDVPNKEVSKRLKVAHTDDSLPELYFMTNRSTSFSREFDRDYLLDLSAFEIPAKAVVASKSSISGGTRCCEVVNKLQEAQTGVTSLDVEKWQLAEEVALAISNETYLSEKECTPQTKSLSNITNGDLGNSNSNEVVHEGNLKMIVKSEAVDFTDPSSAVVTKITCSVNQDSESFLELPDCLPLKVCRQGMKSEQRLVLLRDPVGRLWPVVYHERKRLKVLASGWEVFRKSNSIQPGDQCTFLVENLDEGTFQVRVLRS